MDYKIAFGSYNMFAKGRSNFKSLGPNSKIFVVFLFFDVVNTLNAKWVSGQNI